MNKLLQLFILVSGLFLLNACGGRNPPEVAVEKDLNAYFEEEITPLSGAVLKSVKVFGLEEYRDGLSRDFEVKIEIFFPKDTFELPARYMNLSRADIKPLIKGGSSKEILVRMAYGDNSTSGEKYIYAKRSFFVDFGHTKERAEAIVKKYGRK